MQYSIRWYDPVSRTVREDAATADDEAALARIVLERYESQGRLVVSTARHRPTRGAGWLRRGGRDVAWWCRELRTLLDAGMTVVEALETMQAQSGARDVDSRSSTVVDHLHLGKPLSEALALAGGFPPILVAGVRASERTSALGEALDDYIRYDDLVQRLRKQIVSAAIYPALVVSLGALISLFLLLYVVPRFSQMYGELRGQMSLATRVLVSTSTLLSGHGVLVGVVLGAMIAAGVFAWRRGWIAAAAAAGVSRIGPLQRQIDEYRLAKLYQSLALMFRGGYPLDEALAQCATLGLGGRLGPAVEHARRSVMQGTSMSRALDDAGLADVVALRLLAVGERGGSFDRILQTIADRHASAFTLFIERATRIAEPLLLLVVALLVGGIVVMMYMPIFDIASSLG